MLSLVCIAFMQKFRILGGYFKPILNGEFFLSIEPIERASQLTSEFNPN